jgi:hypothetical protein
VSATNSPAKSDVAYNTAYHVSSRQTLPVSKAGKTRVNDDVRHVIEDGHFKGYHQIGKLCRDVKLRYLYTGEQKP